MYKYLIGASLLFLFFRSKATNGNSGDNGKLKVLRINQLLRSDAEGSGAYGASRGGRQHNGIDIIAPVGIDVIAPMDGTITRHSKPYANDNRYQGVELQSGNIKIKIFYCTPSVGVGEQVKKGQKIATVQNITAKYSPKMINHIHVEYYFSNVLQNPTSFFL